MITEVMTVTEASKNFSDMINRVHYQGIELTLTRNARPVARIMPARKHKRSTGADLLKWLESCPPSTKAANERFADAVESMHNALNVPPVSKYDL